MTQEENRKRSSEWMKEFLKKKWSDPEERKKIGAIMAEGRKRKWREDPEWREKMTKFLTDISRKTSEQGIDRNSETILRYNEWRRLHDAGTEYDDE